MITYTRTYTLAQIHETYGVENEHYIGTAPRNVLYEDKCVKVNYRHKAYTDEIPSKYGVYFICLL